MLVAVLLFLPLPPQLPSGEGMPCRALQCGFWSHWRAKKAPSSATVSVNDLHVPEEAASEFRRGNKALAKNNLGSAENHYNKAIGKYPSYARAYNNLGVVLNKENRTKEAEAAWRKAIAADPHLISAYSNLSELLLTQGRNSEAQPLRQRLHVLDPKRFPR